MNKWRTLLILILTLLLNAVAGAEELTDTQGDMLVTENERFALYLTYEKGDTLQFYVEDKQSGVLYRSSPENWASSSDKKKRMQTGSQLLVTSIDKATKAEYSANSQVSSVKEDGTMVTLIPNGFRVDYDFPRAKDMYKIPVAYTLESYGLRAEILMAEIEEYGDVYVQSVALLPNFCGAAKADQGYLLIPDGCGALIDFQGYRKGMSGYRQAVYGTDPSLTAKQQVGQRMTASLPVLGIQNGDAGVLLIAENSSAHAVACAYPAGSDTVYSSVYFEFTSRIGDEMVMADKSSDAVAVLMMYPRANTAPAVVSYRFCSGADSGYAGMARLYREYLISEGMNSRAEEKTSMQLEIYCGVKKERSVMGILMTDVLAMTTFEQASEMLRDLNAQGVGNLHTTLMGWNKGGLQDGVQKKTTPERKLGGKNGLEKLQQTAREIGAELLCDVDLMRFYKSGISHNSLIGSAQKVTGDAAAQYSFQVSTYQINEELDPYYLLQPAQLAENAAQMVRTLDMPAVSFSTMGQMLYSDFRMNGYVSREDALVSISGILADTAQHTETLSVDYGNGYVLPYIDTLHQTPLFDSGYDVAATDVPFVPLVLHGMVNMYATPLNLSEDQETFLLRMIETGVNPTFALTWEKSAELQDTRYEYLLSTEYTALRQQILKVWAQWQEASQGLSSQTICDHRIEGALRCTTYEDGTKVYVNYGWSDGTMDDNVIPARRWLVVRGGE